MKSGVVMILILGFPLYAHSFYEPLMPSLCDAISQELVLAIVDGHHQSVPTEKTARYQFLKSNQNYRSVNIPRLLAKTKDLEMTGAPYRDLMSLARIECNKAARGAD